MWLMGGMIMVDWVTVHSSKGDCNSAMCLAKGVSICLCTMMDDECINHHCLGLCQPTLKRSLCDTTPPRLVSV